MEADQARHVPGAIPPDIPALGRTAFEHFLHGRFKQAWNTWMGIYLRGRYRDQPQPEPKLWEHFFVGAFLILWACITLGVVAFGFISDAVSTSFSKDNGIFREVRLLPSVFATVFNLLQKLFQVVKQILQ